MATPTQGKEKECLTSTENSRYLYDTCEALNDANQVLNNNGEEYLTFTEEAREHQRSLKSSQTLGNEATEVQYKQKRKYFILTENSSDQHEISRASQTLENNTSQVQCEQEEEHFVSTENSIVQHGSSRTSQTLVNNASQVENGPRDSSRDEQNSSKKKIHSIPQSGRLKRESADSCEKAGETFTKKGMQYSKLHFSIFVQLHFFVVPYLLQ